MTGPAMVEVAGVGTVDVQPFDPDADDDMHGHDNSNQQQDEVSERVPCVPSTDVPNLPEQMPDLAPEPDPRTTAIWARGRSPAAAPR